MLQQTFLHIHGIGPKKEERLWRAGIQHWSDMAATNQAVPLSPAWLARVQREVDASLSHLLQQDATYFAKRLPASQQWRMFPEFRDSVAYLDIETTGLDGNMHDITVIGVYDGKKINHYIMGENLQEFEEAIHQYKVIVTFNGRCFDVPFIEKFFRTRLPHAHIDLRFLLGSLGFRGGLKKCEILMGIDRNDLKDVDGFMAVLLWRDYLQTEDPRSLETLLAYNTLDIVNLERLLVMAYNMKLKETPFAPALALSTPTDPTIPFQADLHVIERIQQARYGI